jgi:hypothetical protein
MTTIEMERRERLQAEGWPQAGGGFDILAISAGEGNGWRFGEAALRESLALWEGVETFVDHGGGLAGRSLRDLGGVCSAPAWDAAHNGIRLRLRTLGPSGPLVQTLGEELLAEAGGGKAPRVGFSADVVFTARGQEVHKILRVLSVDLVFNPARGGAFLRALNQHNPNQGGKKTMSDTDQGLQAPFSQELSAMREARRQMSAYLLEAGLAAARLPAALERQVRARLDGREATPAELNGEIEAARALAAELSGGAQVSGPGGGRIQAMFNTEDQLQAAVDDLLGAPRQPGAQGLRSHRLSGIKELYMLLTGDRDLYGGYYAERVSLATTANFSGLVKNALNKIVAEQWSQLGAAGYDWWQRVTVQEHCESLNDLTGILVGTVGSLPEIAEGAEYTELKVGDSPETASFKKYGGYIPLTLELIDRDETRKLRMYPRELAKAGIRRISALVAEVFTANNGVGPSLADGGALFNTTAVTSAGGHANLRTGALSASEWEAVKSAVYKQPLLIANESGYYGSGPAMAINPRYLLVPRDLELTAMKLLYGDWENAANLHADNLQKQAHGDVVVVPEWTDTNNWAAACDPRLAPGIIIGERFGLLPEVFIAGDELSPAVFMNDEHRLKVRHFVAALVTDYRPLHKSNVA